MSMFSNYYWLLFTSFFFIYLKKMHAVHLDFRNVSERQREGTVNNNLPIVYSKEIIGH